MLLGLDYCQGSTQEAAPFTSALTLCCDPLPGPQTPMRGLSTSSVRCGRASRRQGQAAAPSSTCPHTLTTSGEDSGKCGLAVTLGGDSTAGLLGNSPRPAQLGWQAKTQCCPAPPLPSHPPFPAEHCFPPSPHHHRRVRNFLREEMASFLGLCEYTDRSDAARARSYFFDRRKQVGAEGWVCSSLGTAWCAVCAWSTADMHRCGHCWPT